MLSAPDIVYIAHHHHHSVSHHHYNTFKVKL